MNNYGDDDYRPTYTYFGTLTMTGFPPAELYWYYTDVGDLRIDVRGSYYPFDIDGQNTLENSLHFVACNLHRCEFAAHGTGRAYDESRLPGSTSEITTFVYVLSKPYTIIVSLDCEEREAYKQKTWYDIVVLKQLEHIDVEFRYV